jgi:hypothetical protein
MDHSNNRAMEHPELDDRLREPLDEEERMLMDPDTWDWDNIQEGTPVPHPEAIFEVVLSLDDIQRVEPAAIAEGMTVSAFLRHAALERALQATAKR